MKTDLMYGNFSEFDHDYQGIPAFTVSTDPEHMPETVGQGFPLAGIITSNRTRSLENIDISTETEVLAFSDILEDFSGRKYFIQMSESELVTAFTEPERKPDELNERPWSPKRAAFGETVESRIEEILEEYGSALMFPYMMKENLEKLKDYEGLQIIGPELDIVEELDSKTESYRSLQNEDIRLVPGEVVDSLTEACEILEGKLSNENGAFVSAETGASGSGSRHVTDTVELYDMFGDDYEGDILVQEWIEPIDAVPNVLVLVDDDGGTALTASDQIIENGTDYAGNSYPLELDDETIDTVLEESEKIADFMSREGYRGIAGIDGIVSDGDFYFVEINPRKNHSTVLKSVMLEQERPEHLPPLPVIEAEIIDGETYDLDKWTQNIREAGYQWDMYIVKASGGGITEGDFNIRRDHEWNFQEPYIANIPQKGAYIPRAYSGSKEGRSKEEVPVELGRAVTNGRDWTEISAEYLKNFSPTGGEGGE